MQKSHLCFALVLLTHQSLCQQPSAYSTASGQTKLEDVDRDALKQQSHVASAAPVPPQYVQYATPDQFVYQLQPQQQAVQYAIPQAPGQQNAPPTPLVAAGVAPSHQPQAVYTAGPQQPVIYVNQNGQPIDFSALSLYPAAAAGFPSYVPTTGAVAGKTTPSAAKTVQPHVPNAYIIPNAAAAAALQQYYQPVAFSQPANAQYYYNTLYQLQTPQKSVYSAGVKSTTPAIPVKGKDEQFVGSNYFVSNPNPFDKLRATGRV